ncbi:MAG TPA: hypothetical protein PKY71_03905, partial [Smithellaceae bacterium]|nr:hypothetical protein [Smithellaceae bacterium]
MPIPQTDSISTVVTFRYCLGFIFWTAIMVIPFRVYKLCVTSLSCAQVTMFLTTSMTGLVNSAI